MENQPTPATLAAYREEFGPDYYSFRSGDLEGFVLNSSLIAAPEKAPAEADRQEAWLKAELAKPRAAWTICILIPNSPAAFIPR